MVKKYIIKKLRKVDIATILTKRGYKVTPSHSKAKLELLLTLSKQKKPFLYKTLRNLKIKNISKLNKKQLVNKIYSKKNIHRNITTSLILNNILENNKKILNKSKRLNKKSMQAMEEIKLKFEESLKPKIQNIEEKFTLENGMELSTDDIIMRYNVIEPPAQTIQFTGYLHIIFFFYVRGNNGQRSVNLYFPNRSINITYSQILFTIADLIEAYFATWGFPYDFLIQEPDPYIHDVECHIFYTQDQNNEFQSAINEMKVKKIQFNKLPLNIDSNYDNININCVNHYLTQNYRHVRGFIKKIKNIDVLKEWKLHELLTFLKESEISFKCYKQNLKIHEKFTGKSKEKIFRFIASNEHIYPVSLSEITNLKKHCTNKIHIKEIKYIEDLSHFVSEMIIHHKIQKYSINKKRLEDHDITYVFTKVLIDDILYINDKNVFDSYELFKKQRIFTPLTYDFSIDTPLQIIAKDKKLESSYNNFLDTPKPCYFNNPNINDIDIKSLDKNKSHSYSLCQLEYLPRITSKNHVTIYDNKFDINNFYYISKVKKNYFNMLSVGWCSGHRIKNLLDNIEISHYVKPYLIKNPFSKIINDSFKINPDLSKIIFNIFCGKCMVDQFKHCEFYESITNSMNEIQTLLCDDVEETYISELDSDLPNPEVLTRYKKQYTDFVMLDNGMYAIKKIFEPTLKYKLNYRPISHFIIDNAINTIYEKMQSIVKIDPNVQFRAIKIDAIQYISKINFKCDTNTELSGWKYEEAKLSEYNCIFNNKSNKIMLPIKTYDELDLDLLLSKSSLIDCLAGAGKTHYIINKILPKIKDKNYIVIATKHSTLIPYYLGGFKSKVFQGFTFGNQNMKKKFANLDYIIIDECGLVDDIQYKYIYENISKKTILLSFGDSTQLNPIGYQSSDNSPLTSYQILKLYNQKFEMKSNYRNNYTVDDYDNMKKLSYELTDYEESRFNRMNKQNIAVFNVTCQMVNDYITKDWIDIFEGLKVKNKGMLFSKFKDQKQYKLFKSIGVYNSCYYSIIGYDHNNIYIKDEYQKEYTINKDLFKDNFGHGYCITVFKAQGLSIPYKDIGIFDGEYIKNDGRYLYTVLSRIKDK